MKFYSIHPSENYLKKIAGYLIDKHMHELEETVIYLPTKGACRVLEREILGFLGNKELDSVPKILQLGESDSQQEVLENFNNNAPKLISRIEQKRLITDIIHSYKPLGFTLYQASGLGPSLIKLFDQIESEQINIDKLSEFNILDSAEHWIKISHFLITAYQAFQNYLTNTNQISYAAMRNLIIGEQIESLITKPQNPVIVAGSSGSIKVVRELIKQVASHDNCYAILPAISFEDEFPEAAISPYQPILKLFEFCGVKKEDVRVFPSYSKGIQATMLPRNNIFETDHQFEEAKLISFLIRDICSVDESSKICLVTHNESLILNVKSYLKRFDLELDNSFGYEIRKTDLSSFIVLLAKMVLSEFMPIDILAFFKHKFLISEYVFAIEKALFRGSEIISGYEDLKDRAVEIEEREARDWFLNFLDMIKPLISLSSVPLIDFGCFSAELLRVAGTLYEMQEDVPGLDESKRFFEEFELAHKNYIAPRDSYIFLIDKYMSGMKYYTKFGWESRIFAINPVEMRMLHFDYVIAADVNEGSWPRLTDIDPWMNAQMRSDLGLPLVHDNISKSFHDFYYVLHSKNLIITRSKKSAGVETVKSRFLMSLQGDFSTESITDVISCVKVDFENAEPASDKIDVKVPNSYKPKVLAATHIELLLRNPYAFYARKILSLYPLEDMMKQPDAADFGNFIHKVFEDYTTISVEHSKDLLLLVGRRTLDETKFSAFTKNLWWPKFINIAEDFLRFEGKRVGALEKIYTEIEGRWKIELKESNYITITAKADRIEIAKSGLVNILDYKTGAVPTKKDVALGLSPQLLIEAMIVQEGGFKDFSIREVGELLYVKISSSKPHIKEISIEVTEEILSQSRVGLIKLLNFYLSDDFVFYPVPNRDYAPKYNDYEHLSWR